jgi:hypothetical protein
MTRTEALPRKNPALTAYARTCRNAAKRQYAEDYADYLDGFTDTEPVRPTSLGYMGAQAVRLAMSAILREERAS